MSERSETANEIMARLEKLAGNLVHLNKDRFEKLTYTGADGEEHVIFVYPEPLKRKDGYHLNFLTFPEQLFLYEEAADKLGIKIRHGSLRENIAAYKANGKYKNQVLDSSWVYTGVLVRKLPDDSVDVRKALSVRFVDEISRGPTSESLLIHKGRVLNPPGEETLIQHQYNVGPTVQTSIARKRGKFNSLKSEVPVDSEITGTGVYDCYLSANDDLLVIEVSSSIKYSSLDITTHEAWTMSPAEVIPIFADEIKK